MSGIDGYTKLIYHFNESQGATTVLDSSGNGFDGTCSGNCYVDDTWKKFGVRSAYFYTGATRFIDVSPETEFNLGTSDFTIECWTNITGLVSGSYYIFDAGNADSYGIYLGYSSNKYYAEIYIDDEDDITLYSGNVTVNEPHHVRLVRYGNLFSLYIDGVSVDSATINRTVPDFDSWFEIGYAMTGYLDEFRYDVGIARCTGNFSVPDVEYSAADTVTKTITSDISFFGTISKTITSDIDFSGSVVKTILSDIKFVTQVLYNVNNKVNFTRALLYDINNKVNFVKRQLSNIRNVVNFCKSSLYNINNDVRTKGSGLYNINNDVRFITTQMTPGSTGIESLGKSYIRVYFDTVEQTDAIVDSIVINKSLNSSHTASIDLARPYDTSVPVSDTVVEIKYNNWILYKGKITSVNPTDSTEKINVFCNDKYFFDNRENSEFFVGQEPIENVLPNKVDTYYDTINHALLDEFSWNLDIGSFTPQTISCQEIGKADAITTLLSQSGNYGWYYNIDDTKNLWRAGEGGIVTLDRQISGKNINLFDVISQNFKKDYTGLVNKFKVIMGNPTYVNGRKYISFYHDSSWQSAEPAWDRAYEVLAKESANGYGWDYPDPLNEEPYKEVYTKYYLPDLSSDETYEDTELPEVRAWGSGVYDSFDAQFNDPYLITTKGFSIDYDKKLLIMDEKTYWYVRPSADVDEIEASYAPVIQVKLNRKKCVTGELDAVNNPLVFESDKVGTHPTTIEKTLNLSDLNIQYGYKYYWYKGVQYQIPPWDDTDFATDLVNWNLSNTAYEKINGNIEVVLDTVCFNSIDLSKRIFISGITDTAMNIVSMTYNLNNFTVSIELQNCHSFKRTVSMPFRFRKIQYAIEYRKYFLGGHTVSLPYLTHSYI